MAYVESTKALEDIASQFRKNGWPDDHIQGAISDVTPTRNREETNMLTWPRIRANPIALHVKLCDRIFNMETSLANKSHQLERYGNEYQGFRSALFNGEHAGMWEHLDGLYEQQLQTKR